MKLLLFRSDLKPGVNKNDEAVVYDDFPEWVQKAIDVAVVGEYNGHMIHAPRKRVLYIYCVSESITAGCSTRDPYNNFKDAFNRVSLMVSLPKIKAVALVDAETNAVQLMKGDNLDLFMETLDEFHPGWTAEDVHLS